MNAYGVAAVALVIASIFWGAVAWISYIGSSPRAAEWAVAILIFGAFAAFLVAFAMLIARSDDS